MAYPETLIEKKLAGYDSLFNAVASEGDGVPNHNLRLAIAKGLVFGSSPWDSFVTRDLQARGYNDATAANTVASRILALYSNIVSAGG